MRFSELEGRRIGVWGAGREIASLVRQLARLPAARLDLAVFDAPPSERERATLPASARVTFGPDSLQALAACEIVVRSPGVSIHRPELRELKSRGVPVTTTTALWMCEHGPRGVLAVTGTKGKSTTAALAAHLARAAGVRVALAGNIGAPALDLLGPDSPPELVVLELSSYQIADLVCGAEVVIFLNLFREHVDWHGSEEAYRAEKLRLLALPGIRVAVINGRDEELVGDAGLAGAGSGEVRLFGVPGGWDAGAEGITREDQLIIATASLPVPGAHNALNLAAALAGLQEMGVSPELPDALAGFEPLAHRLQKLPFDDAVRWVDDSISTTPESALAALRSFAGAPLVLIGGGQDRGQDYAALAQELARRGAAVVGIPTTGPRLVAAARAAGVPVELALAAADLPEATSVARDLALRLPEGEQEAVVLLSPAAPSYDSFRDFEERGERFAELARELTDARR